MEHAICVTKMILKREMTAMSSCSQRTSLTTFPKQLRMTSE